MATAIWATFSPMARAMKAACAIASIPHRCALSRSMNWKAKVTARTANYSSRKELKAKEQKHERADRKSNSGWRLFLGGAGFAAQAARHNFHPGGLLRRRRAQRDLPQSRHARRSGRNYFRSGQNQLPQDSGILFSDSRP